MNIDVTSITTKIISVIMLLKFLIQTQDKRTYILVALATGSLVTKYSYIHLRIKTINKLNSEAMACTYMLSSAASV